MSETLSGFLSLDHLLGLLRWGLAACENLTGWAPIGGCCGRTGSGEELMKTTASFWKECSAKAFCKYGGSEGKCSSDDGPCPVLVDLMLRAALLEGAALKTLATASRLDLVDFARRVAYLEINVKVNEDWHTDKSLLKYYGCNGQAI